MQIDSNRTIHDLIKSWAKISFKLVSGIDMSKEEIADFKDIRIILENKGIDRLEVFNVKEQKYVIRYFKYNTQFILEADVNE